MGLDFHTGLFKYDTALEKAEGDTTFMLDKLMEGMESHKVSPVLRPRAILLRTHPEKIEMLSNMCEDVH